MPSAAKCHCSVLNDMNTGPSYFFSLIALECSGLHDKNMWGDIFSTKQAVISLSKGNESRNKCDVQLIFERHISFKTAI